MISGGLRLLSGNACVHEKGACGFAFVGWGRPQRTPYLDAVGGAVGHRCVSVGLVCIYMCMCAAEPLSFAPASRLCAFLSRALVDAHTAYARCALPVALLLTYTRLRSAPATYPETKRCHPTGTYDKVPYRCKLGASRRGDFLSGSRGALCGNVGKVVVEGRDACWTW